MFALGLILLIAAAVVALDAVAQNTFDVRVDLFGQHLNMPVWEIAVGGIVIGVVALLGLALALRGVRKNAQLRTERRRLRKELARRPAVVEPVAAPAPAADAVPAAAAVLAEPTGVATDETAYPDGAVEPARPAHRGLHRTRV
jgi:uncharacterized integral membrane protein